MIQGFINFVEQLFPIYDKKIADDAREAISQFSRDGHQNCCYMPSNSFSPVQGDIIDKLPFVSYDENGEEIYSLRPAMLLSNSCEIDNKDFILAAPVLDIGDFPDSLTGNLVSNKNYHMLYMPGADMNSKVVDLSLANSFNSKSIKSLIDSQKINVIKTLNQLGYYIFLCKIATFLARREDPDIMQVRKQGLENPI